MEVLIMRNTDASRFWEDYVAPIIPEIESGMKWYNFSIASLRTLDELGLVEKHENGLEIVYGNFNFSTDFVGHTHMVSIKQPNLGKDVKNYIAPSANVKLETFIVSLPKISFHP